MKKLLFMAGALAALVSCTNEDTNVSSTQGATQSFNVNVADFNEDAGSRAAVAVTENGSTRTNAFTWTAGDAIGVYPTSAGEGQTEQQVQFNLTSGASSASATFTGSGWGMICDGNHGYYAYYPYSSTNSKNSVTVSYTDNLNQTANGSTAHLGVNDFLYAPTVSPASIETANLSFKHLSALVEFEILVPSDKRDRNFSVLQVKAPSALFVKSGTYNPASATETVVPAISSTETTDQLNLTLNGGAGFTPDANGYLHLFFLVAPATVKDQALTLKLYDTTGQTYKTTVTPKADIEAQAFKTYKYQSTLSTKSLCINASGNFETANCYIVPAAGTYEFQANVKGNGVDPVTTDGDAASIDMTGCTASVVWETVNTTTAPSAETIVKNVAVDGNCVTFEATGTAGNALIALKNASNEIVWSWHIWSTAGATIAEQTYGGATMMDRNLGALSATAGDNLSIGFHYQWGRPFPIPGSATLSSSSQMATTGTLTTEETTSDKGTLDYSAKNPTHFIYASASNYFKGSTTSVSGNWLWTANDYATAAEMPALWGATKTMYDPSPVGWKVPAGGTDGVWNTADFSTTTTTWANYGRTFTSASAYYPAAGYRGASYTAQSGALNSIGSNGLYWSSSVNGANGCSLLFNSGSVNPTNSYVRAFGFSVRPCKE